MFCCPRRSIRLPRSPNLHLKLSNLPRRLRVYFNLVMYIRVYGDLVVTGRGFDV